MKESASTNIIIFKSKGVPNVDVRLEGETVWLHRQQLSELFERNIKTIGKHISNIFKENELQKESVVAKYATTATDGKLYQVEHYNLDVIISVGYRVKSKRGTQFRQWALKILKDHLIKGYSLNEKRLIEKNLEIEIKESNHIMNKIFLIKGVPRSDKNVKIIDHASKYIGSTTDKETMVLKAQILIERFMIQFLKEQSKNKNALDKARFTFRHLVTICQLQHEPEDKTWLWELLNKLCKIRNSFAHTLEIDLIDDEIKDFVRVCTLRFKKEGISIQNNDKDLKFVLVHLCGISYSALSSS